MNDAFVTSINEFGPLFVGALVLSLLFGFKRVQKSYKQQGVVSWIIQYIISSLMTAVLAIATTMVLPLVIPGGVPYEVSIGITAYICVFGVKALDGVVRKKLGFGILCLSDGDDLVRLKQTMTPEQREQYYENCPFRDECLKREREI